MEQPAPAAPRIHPPLPDPVHLKDESYSFSPGGPGAADDRYCLTPEGMQAALENKATLLRWMSQAENLLDFYRNQE